MKAEIKFIFNDTEEDRLLRIAKTDSYYFVLKDISGWLHKVIREGAENYGLDTETCELIDDKLNEIMLSYDVNI